MLKLRREPCRPHGKSVRRSHGVVVQRRTLRSSRSSLEKSGTLNLAAGKSGSFVQFFLIDVIILRERTPTTHMYDNILWSYLIYTRNTPALSRSGFPQIYAPMGNIDGPKMKFRDFGTPRPPCMNLCHNSLTLTINKRSGRRKVGEVPMSH